MRIMAMRQVIFDLYGISALLPGMSTQIVLIKINTGGFYKGLDNMAWDKVYWGTIVKWKKEG